MKNISSAPPSAPISTLLQHISAHIEAKMKQAGLKKKDLARLADVNQNTITAIMSGGDMKLSTLIRVTRALDDTEWLLSLIALPSVSPLEQLKKERMQAQVLSTRQSDRSSTRPAARPAVKPSGRPSGGPSARPIGRRHEAAE